MSMSVIGNFEVDNVNVDQEKGIRQALSYFTKKFGINVAAQVYSHRECKGAATCLTEDTLGPSLIGHRDAGYTACP